MVYDYNKDEIKNNLDESQIMELLAEFGGEPELRGNVIVSKTVCHGGNSHKLYYYSNSCLFHCFTDCSESFDIFELTRKVMSREHPKPREDSAWNLPEAIDFIARKFGFAANVKIDESEMSIGKDLTVIEKYDRIKNIDIKTQEIELKEYDDTFLKHLPHNVIIQPWIDEGIKQEVMNNAGVCYDPKNAGIVIPHYDINNRLIGIRERTLIAENAELYGKYLPARINGIMYNHPLSFNLYNLNKSKDNIKRMGKAIVFESEKSCLKYKSYFGEENDISCGICGSSFIAYQFWLLISQGAKEIIVGLDHDFVDINSPEAKRIIKKLKDIHKKYGSYTQISFLWDKKNLLGYKSSPIDHGPEVFCKLFKERVNLY